MPRCGARFEREEGYFLGAYALNLIVAEFLGLGLAFVLIFRTELRHPVDLAGGDRGGAGGRVSGRPLPVLTDHLDRDGPRSTRPGPVRAATAGNPDRADEDTADGGARSPHHVAGDDPANWCPGSSEQTAIVVDPEERSRNRATRVFDSDLLAQERGASQPPSQRGRPSAATKAA